MCGIVGTISKSNNGFTYDECELFTHLLQMDVIRGKDATGVFGVNKDNLVDIIKADTNAWQFTQSKNYKEFEARMYSDYKITVGHNRAATKGALKASNAHPFREEHIILVHNGTIFNQEELDTTVEVDSHAITKALAKADAVSALESIHGPFALVWYDTKMRTLNLARNNDRPLFLLEYAGFWVFSSEPGLPYWLNGREGRKSIGTPRLVPTKKILQIKLDEIDKGFSEVDYENYSYTAPPVVHHYPISHVPRRIIPTSGNQKSVPFKQGDSVLFKVDDVKHEPDDTDYVIFGHPLFDDEIDMNILVKTDTRLKHEADALQAQGFAKGTLTSITDVGGMPVLYIRFAEPCRVDANKNLSTDDEIAKAVAGGCNRCKSTMVFTDIANAIVRKKKDGTYRTLCGKCLAESKSQVPNQGHILAH